MLKSIRKILSPAESSTVEVTITRSCMIDGKPAEAGSTVTLPAHKAAQVIGQGAGYSPAAQSAEGAEQMRLSALLPPPDAPTPLPENWQELPEVFSRWWTLNQAGLAIENRAIAIEAKLLEKISRFMLPGDLRSLDNVPNQASKSAVIQAASAAIHIGDLPASYHRECEYLRDANARAQEAVEAWREVNGTDLLRLRLQCSDAVLAVHGELSRCGRELAATGRSIFAKRIEALGLHENQISRLFEGSADCVKYSHPAQVSNIEDLKSLWHADEGRDQRLVIGMPVPTLAQLWRGFTERNRELGALLKSAKSELSKATKVAA